MKESKAIRESNKKLSSNISIENRKKSKGSSKSLGNFNDLIFQFQESENKAKNKNYSRSGKGKKLVLINFEVIKTNSNKNSIYLKKIPSNKNMKEIYINKLKLINNDLKLSLKKSKEERKDKIFASEVVMNKNKDQKEIFENNEKFKEFQNLPESPLIKKEIINKSSKTFGSNKRNSLQFKTESKTRISQRLKKSDVIKKKKNELPILKPKMKKNGKDLKKKDKGIIKQKVNDKKTNTKNNSSKIIQKKQGNLRQHGRTQQKKGTNGNYNSKKITKNSQNGNLKYGNKTNNQEKNGLKKTPGDEDKPPHKSNHKLEKGHYAKDHPSAVKPKKLENDKNKIKIKRSGNGLSIRKKSHQHSKPANQKKKSNLNNSYDNNKNNQKNIEYDFDPERKIRKKVAKKKNFSLNLDNFKNKITKDYHTHVDKFVASIENNKVSKKGNKQFQTEKPTSKINDTKSDSEEEFDYKRGESSQNNKEPEIKTKNNKMTNSKNGVRKSGPYASKIKKNNSRSNNEMNKRKKSRGKFPINTNRMSLNFKNNLNKNDKDKRDPSSKKINYSRGKLKNGMRNSSIKDFTKRKKQNLSISMNKRYGMNGNGIRKKSNDHGVIRKKNQSINPGGRFMGMEKTSRKRAVSETHSVSNISFTEIEKAGLRKTKKIVEYIKQRDHILPPFTKARSVVKDFGIIKGFIVNTHKGTVRAGNEDRVSILLNAQHKFKKSQKKMNNCAMFSVFDGHGGTDCCNFLKENLHNKILADLDIHGNFDESIKKIYTEVDATYLKRAIKKKQNYSGSCANSLFVLDDEVVIVNSGDSRTICSKNRGKEIESMSIDHKPGCFSEFSRVINNGGQLYRVSSNLKTIENMFYTVTNYSDVLQIDEIERTNKNLCFGPWRIKPGGLSVSR